MKKNLIKAAYLLVSGNFFIALVMLYYLLGRAAWTSQPIAPVYATYLLFTFVFSPVIYLIIPNKPK